MKPLGQDSMDGIKRELVTLGRLQDALDVIVNDAQIDIDIREGKRCLEHQAFIPCDICKQGAK